jgi:hypothetical protein
MASVLDEEEEKEMRKRALVSFLLLLFQPFHPPADFGLGLFLR